MISAKDLLAFELMAENLEKQTQINIPSIERDVLLLAIVGFLLDRETDLPTAMQLFMTRFKLSHQATFGLFKIMIFCRNSIDNVNTQFSINNN